MIESLYRLWSGSRKHAGEEELLRLADGELGAWHVRRVQRHLEQCWACRSRYEQLQGAILQFVEYRKRIVAPNLPLGNSARDRFLRKLDEVSRETATPWQTRAAYFLRSVTAPMMNPVFATFLIVVAAAAAIFVVWQRNAPTVSASELLDRAQVWDTFPAGSERQGVIYQTVEIHTPTGTMEQSFYHDIEGRRRPRRADASLQQIALQKALQSGGVDWQRPLSASDFRKWNEHLSEKKEEVLSDRHGTLTLRTRTKSSEVQEESLTVRNSDFHPVARRLVLRDLGEIDISELNYEILPWNEVNVAELFEPEAGAPALPQPALRKPVLAMPSAAMLDEAELRARLALSKIDADTGENVSIAQTGSSVAITGFVETQPRKREIDQALAGLPWVRTSVSTFEVRNQQLVNPGQAQPSRISEESVVAQGAPLEVYLAGRSVPQEQAVELSRGLFDEALEIDRQSMVLDALEKRFPPATESALTPGNAALLRELLDHHVSALKAAIQKEKELISAYVGELPAETQPAAPADDHAVAELLQSANENRRLADELLTPTKGGQRPADVILKELAEALQRCQRIAASLRRDG